MGFGGAGCYKSYYRGCSPDGLVLGVGGRGSQATKFNLYRRNCFEKMFGVGLLLLLEG